MPGIITPGNEVKDLSTKMLTILVGKKSFSQTCENFIERIYDMMVIYDLSVNIQQENFWGHFHRFNISLEGKNIWYETICEHFDAKVFHSVSFKTIIYCISREAVLSIMKMENNLNKTSFQNEEELKLTDSEQEVVRYVAGYLVFSLRRKYKRIQQSTCGKSKEVANDTILLLDSFSTVQDAFDVATFLEFTTKWTELVNSGGLVKVNDNMFIFVRRIENVVRKTLNVEFLQQYKGQDLREILYLELEKSTLIDNSWESLSRLLPNRNLAKSLKFQMLMRWIDIRSRSFVNTYVQVIKQKLRELKNENKDTKVKLSKKAQPSLRKTLT